MRDHKCTQDPCTYEGTDEPDDATPSGCDCEGTLHYTSCWWVVYNDDGRDQATGDPEIDYPHECEFCGRPVPANHTTIPSEPDNNNDYIICDDCNDERIRWAHGQ